MKVKVAVLTGPSHSNTRVIREWDVEFCPLPQVGDVLVISGEGYAVTSRSFYFGEMTSQIILFVRPV